MPLPSQVLAGVYVDVSAGQVAGAHWVPAAYFSQPPAPLHLPSLPHAVAPPSMQTPFGSVMPAPTFAQVPTLPIRLQDLQDPAQRLAQQTPCSQCPERHSMVVE